jgi:hypothetical protein
MLGRAISAVFGCFVFSFVPSTSMGFLMTVFQPSMSGEEVPPIVGYGTFTSLMAMSFCYQNTACLLFIEHLPEAFESSDMPN